MKGFVIKGTAKEIKSKIVDHFKDSLNRCIEINGTLAPITIKLSQELDKLIVAEMRRQHGKIIKLCRTIR